MSNNSKSSDSTNWNIETEKILDNIRLNSIDLEAYHKTLYFQYKNIVSRVKVPIIVLSALNSIVSVSLQPYVNQNYISLMTCGLSFVVGVISSVSLLLKLEDNTENEHVASRNYFRLSSEISKVLSLKEDDRGVDADIFLNQKYNEYITFFDKSNIFEGEIKDKLKELHFFGIESSKV